MVLHMTKSTEAPRVGDRVTAYTDTRCERRVIVEITAIDAPAPGGTYVWGYRKIRSARPRQTMYPRRYFVAADR